MRLCYWVAQENYIVALLLFSFIIEIFMIPFAVMQQKNSINAARLRPKEMAIRKKYAGRNDQPTQEKMRQEILEMQQKEGYSPFSGCLPMLIQIPIILSLYNIVYNPFKHITGLSAEAIQQIINRTAELKGVEPSALSGITADRTINLIKEIRDLGVEAYSDIAEFVEKIPTLESLPNTSVLGLDLGLTPSFDTISWLLLIPVLTFVTYFFSSKLTRKFVYQPSQGATDQQTACSNKMMDFTMPLMSVFFTFAVPGAIGVYWIFRSMLGTVKQFVMSKAMPLPKFTEEDYKEAERALMGKGNKPVKKERDPNKPKVRSLHHIDDDDCESYEESKKAVADMEAQRERQQAKETSEKLAIEQAPIKKDDRKKDNK